MLYYDEVEGHADLLARYFVLAHQQQNYFVEQETRDVYLALLESSGWTEEEFDAETLRRIDAGWGSSSPSPRGSHPMPAVFFKTAGSLR